MLKEARYDIYCDSCKHYALLGSEDPCNDCLNEGGVEDSHRPMYHEKKGSYINYLEPDGKSYTRDYRKSQFQHKVSSEELKLYFEKHDDGDWYEKMA